MRTRGARILIIGLALTAVVLAPAASARACSIALCSLGYVAPRGGLVPANAPLVYVAPPGIDNTPAQSVVLMPLDGSQFLPFTWAPDPAGAGQFLIRPTAPLETGASYRLVGVGDCPGGPSGDFNVPFTVGPPQDLPATLGTVTVHPAETSDVDVPGGSACVERHRVAAVLVEASLPDLGDYGSLTQFILKVDGQPWGDSSYGRALNGESPNYPYAVCDGPYPGYGLKPGAHHGELSIHVAGAPSDPPSYPFDFNLDCKAPYVAGGSPTTPGGSGGCALGGAPASNAGTWLVGLCLLALVTRLAPARAARARRTSAGGMYFLA